MFHEILSVTKILISIFPSGDFKIKSCFFCEKERFTKTKQKRIKIFFMLECFLNHISDISSFKYSSKFSLYSLYDLENISLVLSKV
ncbi:hypothetical protein D3C85_724300 [compost metagenome]